MVKRMTRAGERGAAIFIVVMVLTMLTAIGVFAARASSMSEAAAGYERQNTQNHYVAELGLLGAATELGTPKRNAYLQMMTTGNDKCAASQGVDGGGAQVPCYHLYAGEVEKAVNANFPGRPLLETAGDGGATTGSLGPTPLQGDFVVEMTDVGPVGTPVAGSDIAGVGNKFKYVQVTLTATGQVRPATASGATCDDSSSRVAGNESGRAFVVVGPVQ